MFSSLASSFSALPGQRLPNEICCNILAELEPWDAWPLRSTCKHLNNYVLKVLARRYAENTFVYLRRSESWIFVMDADAFTPRSSHQALPMEHAEPSARVGSKLTSMASHRGQKFSLQTFEPKSTVAAFSPARAEERALIAGKLNEECQVIFRVDSRYYRQVRLPSLSIDSNLVMTMDLRELYNHILNMPEKTRRLKEASLRPIFHWIPTFERPRRVWQNVDADSISDEEGDFVFERIPGLVYYDSSGEENYEDALPSTQITTIDQTLESMMEGSDNGEEEEEVEGDAVDNLTIPPMVQNRPALAISTSMESGIGSLESDDEENWGDAAEEVLLLTPRAQWRHEESAQASQNTVASSYSPRRGVEDTVMVPDESFLDMYDSQEASSDSAARGTTYRDVGVQVHPVELEQPGRAVRRVQSWPFASTDRHTIFASLLLAMFGNGWGQNAQNSQQQQQQQQPQQQGFGAFGQPAQQQTNAFGQPQQNTAGTSGFGAFAQPQQNRFGAFGAPAPNPTQPAAGFGAFGATSNAAGTSAFATTPSAFGRPAGAFSAPAAPATSATNIFGAPTAAATPTATQPSMGTASPPYQAYQEKDATAGGAGGVTQYFQTITAMPAYQKYSLEELRLQDYSQGRKSAGQFGTAPATGAFGTAAAPTASTGFGAFGQAQQQQPQQPASTGFGGFGGSTTGAFGTPQQPQQQQPSAFGTGFGATTTSQPQTNAFGQPAATGGGIFGQSPSTATPASGGAFGAFGTTPAQNNTTGGFGAFGAPKPAATTGFGAFGATPTAPATNAFGAFGSNSNQNQQQPASATNAFGQSATSTGFGAFGSTNTSNVFVQPQNQAQAPQTNIFGQPQPQENKPTTGFGTFGSTGAFGQPSQQTQPNAFGQPQPTQQPAQNSLFGGQSNQQQQTQQPAPNGFGNFGAPKPAGGLFGGGGAFGSTAQPQQQPSTGFGAFGNPAASTSAGAAPSPFGTFGAAGAAAGNTQQQQQPQAGGGLFGSKPATTGTSLFGSFGAPAQNQQSTQPQLGTSLFGGGGGFGASTNQPQQPQQPSLFGSSGTSAPQAGSSMFGAMNRSIFPQQSQPSLTASLDQNPFGLNPLLSQIASTPTNNTVKETEQKKSALQFQYTARYVPKPRTPTISRLRGFSTPPQEGLGASTSGSSSLLRASSVGPKSDALNAFTPKPAFGGSLSDSLNVSTRQGTPGLSADAFRPRSSVKKLTIPTRIDQETFANSTKDGPFGGRAGSVPPPTSTPSKIRWNAAAELAAKDLAVSTSSAHNVPGTPLSRPIPSASLATSSTPSKAPPATPSQPAPVAPSNTNPSNPSEGEYWTRPTIAELKTKTFKTLSELPDFTVGRIGYGEITFLKPVDLTSFKAATDVPGGVIEFTARSCVVYVDESIKPSPGKGLNQPARITLEKCWAMDRRSGEWIRDETSTRYKRHIRTLQNKENTDFVSFDNETGTWVFTVEHFTRYGLDDDDDMEEDDIQSEAEMVAMQKPSTLAPPHPQSRSPSAAPPSRHSPSATSSRASVPPSSMASVEPDNMNTESEDDGAPDEAALSRPWASHLGLDPRRVHVMQASLFADDEDGNMDHQPVPKPTQFFATTGSGFRSANAEPNFKGGDISEGVKAIFEGAPSIREDPPPPPPPQIFTRKYTDLVVPQSKSVIGGNERSYLDAGLALGRSFRVSWGPDGTIAHLGKLVGPSSTSATPAHSSVVRVTRVPMLSSEQEQEEDSALRLLQFQKQHSTIVQDENGVPEAIPNSQLRFHNYAQLFGPDDVSHEAMTWRLAQALFDEIQLGLHPSVPYDVRERIVSLRRKKAVSNWLHQSVAPSIESELRAFPNAQTSKKLFALLTGHQIERATELAIEQGDLNLATLLAQTGGDPNFRADIEEQLVRWKEQTIDAHIDDSYRRIYALLAGIVHTLPASKSSDPVEQARPLYIPEHLDWKRVFGLQLWYASQLDSPAQDALERFISFDRDESSSSYAPPWYHESTEAAKDKRQWVVSAQSTENDGLFELLKLNSDLAAPLESVLSPRGYSPSPLDYRIPWHLSLLLCRCLRRRDYSDRPPVVLSSEEEEGSKQGLSINAHKVTVAFAAQLESIGLWKMAIFVLLHLETAADRARAAKDVISRHAFEITPEIQHELMDELKVPYEWIAEAKAILYQYFRQSFEAYRLYIDAKQFESAHDVAMAELAPEAIIRDDLQLLKNLFSSFPAHAIRDWAFRGKLYLDYVECVTRIPEILEVSHDTVLDVVEAADLERLQRTVPQLIQMLPNNLPDRDNWLHNVCLARMLSKLLALQLPSIPEVKPGLVPEAAKLQSIQSSALRRFEMALEGAA